MIHENNLRSVLDKLSVGSGHPSECGANRVELGGQILPDRHDHVRFGSVSSVEHNLFYSEDLTPRGSRPLHVLTRTYQGKITNQLLCHALPRGTSFLEDRRFALRAPTSSRRGAATELTLFELLRTNENGASIPLRVSVQFPNRHFYDALVDGEHLTIASSQEAEMITQALLNSGLWEFPERG